MTRWVWVCAVATGCAGDSDRFLVYDYTSDGAHVVAPVSIPTLTDPTRLSGDLGEASLGGRIVGVDGGGVRWRSGPSVSLPHVVDDGVFVPLDDQGLVLLSFYHHLDEVRVDLADRGWAADMDAVFPMSAIAWTPEQLTGPFVPVENAAYVSGGVNAFVLFEDGNNAVPLGAHAGVVRHELGHAWFAHRVPEQNIVEDGTIEVEDVRALNEGFADIVALLTLDDPLALPIVGRDPREDRDSTQYDGADPYSLGTVFAAFVWDVREILGDPQLTLARVLDALEVWREDVQAERLVPSSLSFAIPLLDAFAEETSDPALCEAFRRRFPNVADRCEG